MKHSLRNRLPKKLGWRSMVLATALVASSAAQAQVSLYSYTETQEEWVEITEADGGYQLGTPAFFPPSNNMVVYVDPANLNGTPTMGGYLTPGVGPGLPIGFDFVYNGDVFDRIGVSTIGWISFGKSEDGDEAVSIFASDHQAGRPLYHSYNSPVPPYKRNRVAGFANSGLRPQDQSSVGGATSSFRMATVGTAPNRVCVIQWSHFRTSYSAGDNDISFQIRLNEAGNTVEVRFGPMDWTYPTIGQVQVGLGGQTNEDFNSRMTVYEEPDFSHDWNTTVAGDLNTSACVANSPAASQVEGPGVYPAVGLNFRWAAPVCAPPAWPLTVSEITYNSALVSWPSSFEATSYDYVVTTENDPDATPVLSGNTEEISVLLEGLDDLTYYYVFVRSNCSAGSGIWGVATIIRTQGGATLVCGEPALQGTHCSSQNTTVIWKYATSDGTSPVRIQFTQGYVGNVSGVPSFRIWAGSDTTQLPLYSAGWGDVLPGQVFTSTGYSEMTMKLVTDNGSCESQPWFTPWEWTVGCLDCTSPLSTYAVVNEDCENLTYDVQLQLVSLGSSSTVIINNDQGVAPTTVSTTGTYVVGPFTAGTPVIITMENPVNDLCNVSSVELLNAPCAIVDCGPTDYSYCYQNDDNTQWLYQGDASELGIRFLRGSTSGGDVVHIYDGSDPFGSVPTDVSGDLANTLITSTNVDNVLLFEVDADGILSCEDGYATEWDYVVACYDGCTQPIASFTTACLSNTQFNVTVTISEIGSSGSVNITNDGGASAVVATAVGTYTVGPFASSSTVNIEVEGASVLCSWTSPAQFRDCTGVGIEEQAVDLLNLFPNPSEGIIRIMLPEVTDSRMAFVVRDMAGRAVAQQNITGTAGSEVAVDLGHLPSGLYIATLQNGARTHTGKLNILH